MTGYLVMACIGQSSANRCYLIFVFTHIGCSLLSLFSSAIFWTRCAVLCEWYRPIIIPLALYGLGTFAYTVSGVTKDFQPRPVNVVSTVCVIATESLDQALCRIFFASFDILIAAFTSWALWRNKSSSTSWLGTALFRDQVSRGMWSLTKFWPNKSLLRPRSFTSP
jgi:hypothetical protein